MKIFSSIVSNATLIFLISFSFLQISKPMDNSQSKFYFKELEQTQQFKDVYELLKSDQAKKQPVLIPAACPAYAILLGTAMLDKDTPNDLSVLTPVVKEIVKKANTWLQTEKAWGKNMDFNVAKDFIKRNDKFFDENKYEFNEQIYSSSFWESAALFKDAATFRKPPAYPWSAIIITGGEAYLLHQKEKNSPLFLFVPHGVLGAMNKYVFRPHCAQFAKLQDAFDYFFKFEPTLGQADVTFITKK